MSSAKLIKAVTVIFLSLCCSLAMAQPQGTPRRSPEQRAERQTEWMEKNLGINRDQSKKVYDIIFRFAQENDKTSMEAPGKEKKMERRDMKVDRDSQLRAVLTPDQFSRLQQHEAEMKEKQRERRAGF